MVRMVVVFLVSCSVWNISGMCGRSVVMAVVLSFLLGLLFCFVCVCCARLRWFVLLVNCLVVLVII